MGFFAIKAELDAGIAATEDGCYAHAHAILLALFLSPDIPPWFRTMFCAPPLHELASAYLPTRAALGRMRSRASGRLVNGELSPILLQRALMLDDALRDRDAAYGLVRRLDVVGSALLVHCRDAVIPVFAEQGDMPRARKYLGNYRDAIAAVPRLQDVADTPGANGDWAEATLLAHADLYVRRLRLIEEILRASGELPEADRVQQRADLMLADQAFRHQVACERLEPGLCLRTLRGWYERGGQAHRPHMLEESHTAAVSRRRASISVGPTR